MSSERTRIIQLKPECWEILKDLKLRSVAEEPIAFADFERLIKSYISRTNENWQEWLNSQSRISVFATKGDDVVGMVSAVLGKNTAYVQHMYVEIESRGRGISRQLLENLLDNLKSRGMRRATLGVLEPQAPAINLYRSLGFLTKATVVVSRGNQQYHEFLMEKIL